MEQYSPRYLRECAFAIVATVFGLGVAAFLAPHEAKLFWPNFGFYWLPQAAILGVVLCLKPFPALLGGVAIALAAYLIAFWTWLFSRSHPESMAWLGFYLSLPGALIGAGSATLVASRRPSIRPAMAVLLGFGLVVGGITVSQTVVCSTVLYCLGH